MIETNIQDLTAKIKANLQTIKGNTYLDNYLIDEFFHFVYDNQLLIRDSKVAPYYLELQHLVLDAVLLQIIVGNQSGVLYNSTMTYNASCTEEDIQKFYNIPYGGDGEIEHLCTHTGYGNGTSDLDAGRLIEVAVTDGQVQKNVVVGPKFEVKDYKNLESANYYFEKGAETSTYHDATHVFIHILDTNTYFIAENRKTSNWLRLANTDTMKHYRQQVILWLDKDGFLGVKFR
jgi:hypothetical protein